MVPAGNESDHQDPVERHLGLRLKELRMERGLSEAQVDALARQPVGTCKMLERGAAFFGPSQLHALARSFGIDPSFFFEGLMLDDIDPKQVPEAAVTKEAKNLAKAFHHIEDPALRKKIISLVKAVSD